MKKLGGIFAGMIAGVTVAGLAFAGMNCDEAAVRMMDGNKAFACGKCTTREVVERRKELVNGQSPFAIVVTCSDSRVAPEYIFDQGLGDIFVIRVAGNVVDPIAIGSIEYAAEHLHSPLLIILGHQNCGAVGAAMKAEGEVEGNIGAILKKIEPAVARAKAAGKADAAETLDLAVQENIKNVADDITANSHILRELMHEGKLRLMLGEYYLVSGKVEFIQAAKADGGEEAHAHAE